MNPKVKQKIFASPPTKIFNCSKDMFTEKEWECQLKEWIKVLVKENEKLKESFHPKTGLLTSESATLIFTASRRFAVSSTTKFLALDIYHKFCLLHIEQMTKFVLDEGAGEEDPKEFLSRVQVKVGQQAPLRVLTCLWIASKLNTHKRGVTKENVVELLSECETDISEKTVCKSELRILQQIHFRCMDSRPLPEYVGILITLVGTIQNPTGVQKLTGLQVDGLYHSALQVLEFVFCNYDLIYRELFYRVTGLRVVSNIFKDTFARVQCDKMLLASSAVAAASWIHGQGDLSSSIVDTLSIFTEIPSDDINTFSACIIARVFNTTD